MKKIILISLVVALVFFILGYFTGKAKFDNASPTASGQLSPAANTFQAGYDAAKKRLVDTGFDPVSSLKINNIYGQVLAVNNNELTLKIRPLSPLADSSLDERTIEIGSSTKIYISQPKDPALYHQEMLDFNQKIQAQAKNVSQPGGSSTSPITPLIPPDPLAKKVASMADIKVSDSISVLAAPKDVKNLKQFRAKEITIQSSPVNAVPTVTPLSASITVTVSSSSSSTPSNR